MSTEQLNREVPEMNDSQFSHDQLRDLSVQIAELKGSIDTLTAMHENSTRRTNALETKHENTQGSVSDIYQRLARHNVIISILSAAITAIVVDVVRGYMGS